MLEEYKKKRDFKKTGEPPPLPKRGQGPLKFVVHKHSARHLHYDLRLEADGVLKSWALPNGPSLDPRVKRLAVMVEDHPLDYGSFEGSIPEGEYGAGQVIIWDAGTYSVETETKEQIADRDLAEETFRSGLEKGKISLTLNGQKLKGSWALVRLANSPKNWLLIKHKDEFADPEREILTEGRSISSGLTIEDIKNAWTDPPQTSLKTASIKGAIKAPFPSSFSPMLATLIEKPFNDPNWIFEPKLDGYRILASVREGKTHLVSRNGLDVTPRYSFLTKELTRLPAREILLDGEIVALDKNGRSCFQCLQNHLNEHSEDIPGITSGGSVIIYYVFDVLYFNGFDLSSVPLMERKKLLQSVIHPSEHLRVVDYFETEGESLFEASVKNSLEGILAKEKNSLYESGQRSRNWLKIKVIRSDEFVVGGFTRGTGNREKSFGSLLLGSYDDKGSLVFNGHVGTGFDDQMLGEMRNRLDDIRSETSYFDAKIPLNAPATWVRPELVVEVKYAEKTLEGYLRQPVFLRLRQDKVPVEVRTGIISSVDKPLHEHRSEIEELEEQLKTSDENFKIEVGGHSLSISNPDKLLWPSPDGQAGLTKRDLLTYLARVSLYILPHLKDRPVTLTRYPNGITGEHFYQKHIDTPVPDFVKTVSLSEHAVKSADYFVCNNLATLLWLGQLGNIDIHSWFSRIVPDSSMLESDRSQGKTPNYFSNFPDFIIFDIDPYIYSGKENRGAEPELNPAAFKQTCKTALWLKDVLDGLSLDSFIKTSGRTGLHIYVPIFRQLEFPAVHAAAKTICGYLLKQHPSEITVEWTVAKRTGKIFLDYNQNVRGKTLASIYSPRPAALAPVSTPLRWDELEKIYPTDFTIKTVPARLAKTGDLWSDILEKRADVKKVLGLAD
jgi:bifunctional non-homologous end joining protein LigD